MRSLLVATTALITACAPEPTCGPAEDATLELGTGVAAFEPILTEVSYEPGPQGGFHVWGSLRAQGIAPGKPNQFGDPDNPVVSYTITLDGEIVGGFTEVRRPFFRTDTIGVYEIIGEELFLFGDPEPLVGREVQLDAAVLDACGATASATQTATLTGPPR